MTHKPLLGVGLLPQKPLSATHPVENLVSLGPWAQQGWEVSGQGGQEPVVKKRESRKEDSGHLVYHMCGLPQSPSGTLVQPVTQVSDFLCEMRFRVPGRPTLHCIPQPQNGGCSMLPTHKQGCGVTGVRTQQAFRTAHCRHSQASPRLYSRAGCPTPLRARPTGW